MTYNLFIDDERFPKDAKWAEWYYTIYNWEIARTEQEVIALIKIFGFPSVISFDHDLGYNEPTGYDIAKRLCEMDMNQKCLPADFAFYIHSKNPIGAKNIYAYLTSYMTHRNKITLQSQ